MDYQTYKTRKEAEAAIKKMMGWKAKPEQMYAPDHPDANRNGNVWVIWCNSPVAAGYMRTDGYVRE